MSEVLKDAGSNGALVRVSNLSKDYVNRADEIPVLRGVNMTAAAGDIVGVMGPSGSGKSTLLFILGLFLKPSRGSYHFAGEDVLRLSRSQQAEFRRNRVGFVFQSADLLENSTVYENLEFPLIYAGIDRRKRPAMIEEALGQVKLTQRIRHPANLLSGGERQRVAVARALVNRPQIILADEPTGQLDRDNTHMTMDHLEAFVSARETAAIVVTHDPEVASRCNKVLSLEDGVLLPSHGHHALRLVESSSS
jgi:putative ABC transport system ATP-binding protein